MARRAKKAQAAAPARGLRLLWRLGLVAALAFACWQGATTVPVNGRTLASRAAAWLEPAHKPRTVRAEARLPAELARTAVVLPDAHAADLIKPDEKHALDTLIQQKTEQHPSRRP